MLEDLSVKKRPSGQPRKRVAKSRAGKGERRAGGERARSPKAAEKLPVRLPSRCQVMAVDTWGQLLTLVQFSLLAIRSPIAVPRPMQTSANCYSYGFFFFQLSLFSLKPVNATKPRLLATTESNFSPWNKNLLSGPSTSSPASHLITAWRIPPDRGAHKKFLPLLRGWGAQGGCLS